MDQQKRKKQGGRYSLKGSSLWGVLIFCVLILVDLLTKMAAEIYFSDPQATPIAIIPDWILIDFTYNRGISYGMGSDAPPVAKIIVIAATAVIMLLLSVLYFKVDKRRSLLRVALVFVVAGGAGNLIDRVYYKVWQEVGAIGIRGLEVGVRDMVNISRLGFGICNFADFFISAGAVLLVLAFLFFDRDAFFPVGKYKALAKELEEKEAEKQAKEDGKNNG